MLIYEPLPEHVLETCSGYIALNPDIKGEIGTRPISVNSLYQDEQGAWSPSLPLIAWMFPLFLDGRISGFIFVGSEEIWFKNALPDSLLGIAFELSIDLAENSPLPCRLRYVRILSEESVFWLQGDTYDTFVSVEYSRIMSGPEFIANLQYTENGEE
jgi:hypothetical protein